MSDQQNKSNKHEAAEKLRGHLADLGYLRNPVERAFSVFAGRSRTGALVVALLYSLLTGLMLTGLTVSGRLIADPEFIDGIGHLALLAMYLVGVYSCFVLVLLLVPTLMWSARRYNYAGREQLGSPVRALLLGAGVSAIICIYLFGWWHAELRSSRTLLPLGAGSVVVMVVICLISLLAGRLLGFVYLLTTGVGRLPARYGNYPSKSYLYSLAVIVLIAGGWSAGVFRRHSADHTLAQALEIYEKPSLPVLLVGIDGLDRPTIEKLAASDSLPHMSGLLRAGFSAPLRSRSEYLAPQVWSTVSTGIKPEVHGLEGFTHPVPWGMSQSSRIAPGKPDLADLVNHVFPFVGLTSRVPTSTASRMTRTLWEINELFGNPSGVVNWWGSWPADVSDGFTITERTFAKITYFHRQQEINPSNYYEREVFPPAEFDSLVMFRQRLAEPFEQTISGLPVISSVINKENPGEFGELIQSVCFADYFYCMSALETHKRRPAGFMAVYFQGPDVLDRLEERMDNVDPEQLAPLVREYYRYMDYLLGMLINSYQPNGLLTLVCDPGKRGRQAGVEGMVLFSGMDVGHGVSRREPVFLEDIAPTVLYLSGLPVSRNMSGRVVREAGEHGPGGARQLRYVITFGPPSLRDESAGSFIQGRDMLQRLRAPGYVR